MGFLKTFTRRYLAASSDPAGKAAARAYAVGDVHGRRDLLDNLLDQIRSDIVAAPSVETFVVFLGDLIDRGPDSREVIERLIDFPLRGVRPIFLSGNHEEVLLNVLDAQPGLLQDWLRFGGSQCAASYGVDPAALKRMSEVDGAAALAAAIPRAHIDFLASMGDTFRFGDYLFVHAGIRPGIPIDEQSRRDLRWIREPFLTDGGAHGFIVVHGHTVSTGVDERSNRIGIDTGAYGSGVLTALIVEGENRRYLSARQAGIATAPPPVGGGVLLACPQRTIRPQATELGDAPSQLPPYLAGSDEETS